jgi:hypothetical protein
MLPEEEDAEEAIKLATKIFSFVMEKIEAKYGEINLDIFSYIKASKK